MNDLRSLTLPARQTLTLKETKMSSTITPYLNFAGRCDEALNFYRTALGAEVEMLMRFDESPQATPPGMLQAGFERKVMHASFRIRGVLLMASDGCNDQSKFEGFRLNLGVADEAEARRAFDALADGGTVQMPLTKTFWSPCYGMVTDRFGLAWMVMVSGPAQ
jgi:PhnB protein